MVEEIKKMSDKLLGWNFQAVANLINSQGIQNSDPEFVQYQFAMKDELLKRQAGKEPEAK